MGILTVPLMAKAFGGRPSAGTLLPMIIIADCFALFDRAIRLVTALREIGCRFALDDFGSGLSSFGYLKNLPMDFLKIDGGLVRHIVENPIDAAMVGAINDIGHVMGLQTIAEYVENDAIRNKLASIGVDYIQGFGIEIPHPLLVDSLETRVDVRD